MTDTARHGALSLLLRWEREGSFANLLVDGDRLSQADARERALTVAIFYGTVERALSLDFFIGALSGRPASGLEATTRALLRMGLYQLLYMDVPAHAAVAETVALGRHAGERALVNAVLRKAAAAPPAPPPRERNLARHLSVVHSLPVSTVRYFLGLLPEAEAEALLAAFNRRPPLCLRVNTLRTDRAALLARLRASGLTAEEDALSPVGIRVQTPTSVESLPGYREGEFFVQDTASQLASLALDPRAGETVLDMCACPGGKSFGAAILSGGRAHILSRDIHKSKLSLITSGAERLGLSSVTAQEWDATVPDPALLGRVDRVICDVPCSGLGVIAKKPDLRYRGTESAASLRELSARIMAAGALTLKAGGVMLFSTCTLTREENEDAVAAFLASHDGFTAEDFTVGPLTSQGGMLTLWPHRHGTDGFFMAKIRRT